MSDESNNSMGDQTLQVDKSRLKEKVDSDRQKSRARSGASRDDEHSMSSDQDRSASTDPRTLKMDAVPAITRDSVSHDGSTVPMPAINTEETRNFAVPEELLAEISEESPETMELDLKDVVVERQPPDRLSPYVKVENDFVLERLTDDTVEGEFSNTGTDTWRRQVNFEASLDANGDLRIPREIREEHGFRPGTRFMVVATVLTDDD